MTKEQIIKAASYSYYSQRSRCYNKRNKRYKNVGAKGVKVRYERLDFLVWWLHSLQTFKGTVPTCGRIDHDKDYSFDNIVMQDKAENSRERSSRAPIPLKGGGFTYLKKVKLYDYGIEIKTFNSISDAAKQTGKSTSNIGRICRGIQKQTQCGLSFKFI